MSLCRNEWTRLLLIRYIYVVELVIIGLDNGSSSGWRQKSAKQMLNSFLSHPKEKYLQWRHNERDGVSNHRHLNCLLNHLFGRRPKKTSKLRVTGLCVGNSPVTGEFLAQRASNAENASIWWRHYVIKYRT